MIETEWEAKKSKASPKKQVNEHVDVGVCEELSVDKKLSEQEAKNYNQKIRENFRQRLGEDGYYHYQLFGECYIHGMMDGEAMAYQNAKGIRTKVFELR